MNTLFRQAVAIFDTLKRHQIVTAILVVLSVVLLGFGIAIGFAPIVVLVAPIGLTAWLLLTRRQRSHTLSGRAEASATGEPRWATPQTRSLMVRACFGCHSNEVKYPSYITTS